MDDGTSVSDWDEEERRRKMSINTSLIPCEWQGYKLNVLDTPGYMDFVGEVISAIHVADSAVVVLDSVGGVEVGTEQVWHYANERNLPRLAFVNKMERENVDFGSVVAQISAKFDVVAVPIQLPIGSQADFKGVVDLLAQKAYLGEKATEGPIPDDMADAVEEARMVLIEAAAEGKDELMEKYFEEETLSDDEIRQGLKARIAQRDLVPVLCGSAAMNIGMQPLMQAIIQFLPSPVEAAPYLAQNPATGAEVQLQGDSAGDLAALVFKTMADPYVGKLSYFRVYSGTLESDSRAYNNRTGDEERIGQVYIMTRQGAEPYCQGPGGRHCGGSQAGRDPDRRHALRPGSAPAAEAAGLSQPPLFGGGQPQDQGRCSQDQPHADPLERAGSDPDLAPGPEHPRDHPVGYGRHAHQRRGAAHGRDLWPGPGYGRTPGALSGDHHPGEPRPNTATRSRRAALASLPRCTCASSRWSGTPALSSPGKW